MFSMRCQGIRAANRGNIPSAISDTGFWSAIEGMYDEMIGMILGHFTDGTENRQWGWGGRVMHFICRGTESVYVCGSRVMKKVSD